MAKPTIRQVPFFFLLTNTRSCLLAEIGWCVCILKSRRILCVLFSRMDSSLCQYPFFIWPNFSFLYNSQWIILLLLIWLFHISVSWWSFTGDWVTASLLKSPGLFSVFWLFSIMLLLGWSPLGRQLPLWYLSNSFRVFHISVSWWFFTGVWVTASLLKYYYYYYYY